MIILIILIIVLLLSFLFINKTLKKKDNIGLQEVKVIGTNDFVFALEEIVEVK